MEEAYEVSCCVVNKKFHLRNSIYKKFKLNREHLCPTKSFHCIRLPIPSTYHIVNQLRIINTKNNRKTNTNLSNQMLNHLPFYCSHLIIYSETRQKDNFWCAGWYGTSGPSMNLVLYACVWSLHMTSLHIYHNPYSKLA